MELLKLETDWKLVELNGFMGIDLMLVSAFGVYTCEVVLLLVYS